MKNLTRNKLSKANVWYWQEQVNYYSNTIEELEAESMPVPQDLRKKLKQAKASLTQWIQPWIC